MHEYLKSHPLVMSFAFVFVGFVIGIIIEFFIVRKLKKIALKTRWEWDDALVTAFHWMPLTWLICAGIYAAEIFAKLDQQYKSIINKILIIVLIASVTVFIARLASSTVQLIAKRVQGVMPSTTLFNRTTTLIIFFIGGFIILQNLNIEITPLLTALGVGGLAVALALQDTLNNLFSGIQIMVTRQVRPGDYVRLSSGEEGYVVDIKGRNTSIRSFPNNNMIIVPNSELVSTIVTNYNLPEKQMWVKIPVGVSYDSDLEHVEKVTLEVAREVLKDLNSGVSVVEPVLRYTEFGDSSINFNIRLFINEFASNFNIRHEFIKRLHKRYNQEGIEIPFPIRTVYHKNVIV